MSPKTTSFPRSIIHGNELHKYSKFEFACHFTVVLSCIWRKPRFSKNNLNKQEIVRLTNSRDRINFYQIMLSCAHFSPPHAILSLWLLFEFAAEARESFSHKLLVPTHSARTPSSIYQRSRVSKIMRKIILRSYRASSRFSCRMNQKRRRLFKLIRARCWRFLFCSHLDLQIYTENSHKAWNWQSDLLSIWYSVTSMNFKKFPWDIVSEKWLSLSIFPADCAAQSILQSQS